MAELTVTDLGKPARKHDPIWVLNNVKKPNIGPLAINVVSDDGSAYMVTVPATFIPVDLTLQAQRAHILASRDFRIAALNGTLKIVDGAEAEEILGTNEAAKEAERLRQQRTVQAARGSESFAEQETVEETEERRRLRLLLEARGEPAALINRLRLEELSQDDWRFVAATARSLGRLEEIEEYAKKQIEKENDSSE